MIAGASLLGPLQLLSCLAASQMTSIWHGNMAASTQASTAWTVAASGGRGMRYVAPGG